MLKLLLLLLLLSIHLRLVSVNRGNQSAQHIGVVKGNLVLVYPSKYKHFVVVKSMRNVGFSGGRNAASGLELSPELGVHVVLIQIVETVLLATAAASEHYQEVVYLAQAHKMVK